MERKCDCPRYDEAASQLDDVRRENRTLSDEIKDLMEQISEGGRSIHEIEKQRKKLEAEKVRFEPETASSFRRKALFTTAWKKRSKRHFSKH